MELSETLWTPTTTVPIELARKPPSTARAWIVVEPAEIPVTTPDAFTAAIEPFVEDQVTVLLVALEGRMVAVIDFVDPVFNVNVVGDNVIDDTETVTVIIQFAVNPPHDAVMVAEPAETAVTIPDDCTVTLAEFELHVTTLLVALEGATVAIKERVLVG